MGLKLKDEWRFDRDAPPMPQRAVGGFIEIFDKIAASADSQKFVYETVKSRFGNSGSSSNASFAQSDMCVAMQSFADNAAIFIDSAWMALQDLKDEGLATPTAEQVNQLLAEHAAGYTIDLPYLRKTTSVAASDTPSASSSTQHRYVLGEKIGGGGYGEVYRAKRDAGIAIFDYAVKVHDPSPFKSADKSLKRFGREVQAIQKLQHRGVVPYLDAGVNDKGQPFLVMPLVEGKNLRDATSPDQPLRSVVYLIEVVRALAYAHENDVLHRDLKPPNILVRTSDEQPIIVDFGLAYVFEDATKESLTSAAPGSAGYIPPEVFVNPKERSPLHDIYSCGVILYELLARRLPDDPRTIDLASIDPGFAPVDEVIRKAVAPSAKRYQTARQLLDDLSVLAKKIRSAA